MNSVKNTYILIAGVIFLSLAVQEGVYLLELIPKFLVLLE